MFKKEAKGAEIYNIKKQEIEEHIIDQQKLKGLLLLLEKKKVVPIENNTCNTRQYAEDHQCDCNTPYFIAVIQTEGKWGHSSFCLGLSLFLKTFCKT